MEIIPLGDSALIVRVRERFEDSPEETLDEVLRTFQQLRSASIPSVIELTPAYTTVAVFFDPIAVAKARERPGEVFGWLREQILHVVAAGGDRGKRRKTRRAIRSVEIPVCYEGEFALDLSELAQRANLSVDEVIQIHAGAEYRVHCVGFTPGFAFLSGLDAKLATPRRATGPGPALRSGDEPALARMTLTPLRLSQIPRTGRALG